MQKGKTSVKSKIDTGLKTAPKKRTTQQEPFVDQSPGLQNYNMPQGNSPGFSPLYNTNSYGGPNEYEQGPMMSEMPEMRMGNFIDNSEGGESVKVAMRIRPMSHLELSRGDEFCLRTINDKTVQLFQK